jgi:hypothetical protein
MNYIEDKLQQALISLFEVEDYKHLTREPIHTVIADIGIFPPSLKFPQISLFLLHNSIGEANK